MFKKFKFPWFSHYGIVIYPVSLPGLIISIAAMVYIVFSFIDIDSRSHSASDTLRPFIIRCLMVYVVCSFIAVFTGTLSHKRDNLV